MAHFKIQWNIYLIDMKNIPNGFHFYSFRFYNGKMVHFRLKTFF